MKILLLGANGQLGRTFLDHRGLAARGELVATSRDGVLAAGGHGEAADLSIPESLPALLDRIRPDVIVNTAAYTAVDRAEQEEDLATRVNGEAVGVLGHWAAAHDALVIHYSTDYVFDGSQSQPYTVNAATGPLGAYGRSKLAGEQALRDSGADHLIFRTAWVYAAHGHNFLRTMLRLGAERDELRVVADQHGAPTDTNLIVNASLATLDRWQRSDTAQRHELNGTHHLVASGATTWYGFACAIFEQAFALGAITHVPRVVPIGSTDFPTPAVRPAYSLLDNAGFQRHFDFALPDWRQGLHEVVTQLDQKGH
ncbi:dTDP-4-dehydrorhamnose reductase [Rhodanobacter denitrificans]|uniref:dTDP-4-dehydrorhamnose reductase n=1 Tax=Rhodanobacter denitrificans TaxID=666685 RepID=M4NAX3_9GAMM|nr:dTDP-4-dehydrorhamnose reductase [Rhodanobacter denitrificans]AGG87740.1 dTDP-4-dehydrorhamnose reductase [Rhodanobacter denitrificans]UJM86907.1 dTDP-4-dehydrorhamnose reductase [Rhodanobacter denitrificans]